MLIITGQILINTYLFTRIRRRGLGTETLFVARVILQLKSVGSHRKHTFFVVTLIPQSTNVSTSGIPGTNCRM